MLLGIVVFWAIESLWFQSNRGRQCIKCGTRTIKWINGTDVLGGKNSRFCYRCLGEYREESRQQMIERIRKESGVDIQEKGKKEDKEIEKIKELMAEGQKRLKELEKRKG